VAFDEKYIIVLLGTIVAIKMIFVVRDFRDSSFICNFAKKLKVVFEL
jgi:hypothetical protein